MQKIDLKIVENLLLNGKSLRWIARKKKVCRTILAARLKIAGIPIPKPNPRPTTFFNGRKYAMRKDGYWHATSKPKTFLHRDMFEFYAGRKIKEGWQINHKDHDKSHNEMSNFEEIEPVPHAHETNWWTRNKGASLPNVDVEFK